MTAEAMRITEFWVGTVAMVLVWIVMILVGLSIIFQDKIIERSLLKDCISPANKEPHKNMRWKKSKRLRREISTKNSVFVRGKSQTAAFDWIAERNFLKKRRHPSSDPRSGYYMRTLQQVRIIGRQSRIKSREKMNLIFVQTRLYQRWYLTEKYPECLDRQT